MRRKSSGLLKIGIEEDENTPLIDPASYEDEHEDPEETFNRLALSIGKLIDLSQHKKRFFDFLRRNPYKNLDRREDSELEELGKKALKELATSAMSVGAGQVLSRVSGIGALGSVPDAISAANNANKSIRLFSIAEKFKEHVHNEENTRLKKTIENCAYQNSVTSGGKFTAIVVGLGAGAAATAAFIIVATGGIAIPVLAITAGGAAASFSGAKISKAAVNKTFNIGHTFNINQISFTLIENAIQTDDEHARDAAREALIILGLTLKDLDGIVPTPNSEDPPERKRLNEKVKGLLK